MPDEREWQDHKGLVLDSADGFDVIECRPCGFKHIVPIPIAPELDRYYEDKFYAEKSDYVQSHRDDLEWWSMVNAERYDRFEHHLSGRRGRILDVGCGPGFFLDLGKRRGWDTVGIEPSRQAAAHATSLGLHVINDSIHRARIVELGQFDVVHAGWVVEHLPDPAAFVRLCYELVKPGGLFCVVAANDYNPLQEIVRRQFGYTPWWLVPPEHINYFTITSLEHLLVTSCAFEAVHVTTTFPMELFLIMGDNYVGNQAVGRVCHRRRKNLEFALANGQLGSLRSKLYEGFARHGIGRDIIMTVRRRG